MKKTLKTTLIAAASVAAVITVSTLSVVAINQYRADQAVAAQAEQDQIVAEQQAQEFDALVVKFASPAEYDGVKAPPPPPAAPPAAEAPPADEGGGDAGPVLCPAGSTANSSDGYNDTSCFPDLCFNISVPDPAHPECDVAFVP